TRILTRCPDGRPRPRPARSAPGLGRPLVQRIHHPPNCRRNPRVFSILSEATHTFAHPKNLCYTAAMKPLPPGLDPVQAGRFGLWLWGRREHSRRLERSIFLTRVQDRHDSTVCWRGMSALLPWRVAHYPSLHRGLAELLGVSVRSARSYLWQREIP